MKRLKVMIWGFGAMGKGISEMILEKEGFQIVGVCDLNPNLVGKDIYEVLEISKDNKNERVFISDNIDDILNNQKIDIVILATDSFTKKAYDKIIKIAKQGINVISTAEEMAYPYAQESKLAMEIDKVAKENNVTVLGTGINPGFIMDLLAISLTGVMRKVDFIECERVNSLSPFGPTVMEEQGVGISLEKFNKLSEKNQLAGHVGFKESVHMIADAVGVKIDKFDQQMKPIITSVDRRSKYGTAKKGNIAGINMTAQGYSNGNMFIDMKHPQQIEPELEGTQTGDYIKIKGLPEVNMSITPEIDGGIGTIAICVNMIPHVLNAKPGLKTMIDLPVPRAILGDVRNMLDENKGEK